MDIKFRNFEKAHNSKYLLWLTRIAHIWSPHFYSWDLKKAYACTLSSNMFYAIKNVDIYDQNIGNVLISKSINQNNDLSRTFDLLTQF